MPQAPAIRDGSRRSFDVRGLLSLVMLVVASLATIATSPPYSVIEGDHQGASFDLSPTTPEVILPFRFEISEAAQAESDFWGLSIDVEVVWRGVDSSQRRLGYRLIGRDGQNVREGTVDSSSLISCPRGCSGAGELVLSFPADVGSGLATVDWSARAEATFDTSDVPEDATIGLWFGDPPTETRTRAVVNERFGPGLTSRWAADLTSSDDSGALWLDVPGFVPDEGSSVYVVTSAGISDASSEAVLLEAPADCGATCTWSVEVIVVRVPALHMVRPDRWRLVEIGGAQDVVAEPMMREQPAISVTTEGGPVTIDDERQVLIPMSLSVAGARETVETQPPVVHLILSLSVDQGATDYKRDERLQYRIAESPDGAGTVVGRSLSRWGDGHVDRGVEASGLTVCSGDRCVIDVLLEFSTNESFGGTVTFDWRLDAEVVFPVSDDVPEGVDITWRRP